MILSCPDIAAPIPGDGTEWNSRGEMCSYAPMSPAAVLGEIWGSRRADAFDQCCRPS
jgi:hypothetical protein